MQKLVQKLQRHGARNFVHTIGMRAINAAMGLKVLRGVHVAKPDAAFLSCPEGYRAGFLTRSELERFAADPKTEISPQFLAQASARGDACFALRHGETLAAYGWYATGPTPIGREGVLRFDPRYVYMYKGFTDERHRGRRLHALGMTMALAAYLATGYEGIVSYVESTNFDSLKSCLRMGYVVFGSVYLASILGRWLSWASPGCRRFAFEVEPTPDRKPAADAGATPGQPS